MNIDTGHLIDTTGLSATDLTNLQAQGYLKVPAYLTNAARRKLRGQAEATVSLKSGGKLAKWAAGERKQRKVRSYKEFCR